MTVRRAGVTVPARHRTSSMDMGVRDMTASATDWPDSILDAVDTAFAALTGEPAPLSLDLDKLGLAPGDDKDLPAGVTALPALQTWLLKHPLAYTVRDAVWAELIRRARLDGP